MKNITSKAIKKNQQMKIIHYAPLNIPTIHKINDRKI
jgi:hypothetical protein